MQVKCNFTLELAAIQEESAEHDEEQIEPLNVRQTNPLQLILQLRKVHASVSCGNESSSTACNIDEELSGYLKRKFQPTESEIVTWWKAHKSQQPRLFQLAEKYLCIPATSAPAERAFSSAGLSVGTLRTRLTGDHVEALNFLHLNQQRL